MIRGRTSLEHGNRQAWLLAAIVVLLVLALLAAVGVGVKEVSDAHTAADRREAIIAEQQAAIACVAKWANTYSERAQRIAGANSARIEALDTLVRSLRSGSREEFARAYSAYLHASDSYKRAASAQPLPPAPKFLCDQLRAAAGTLPSPQTVTVTATPKPSTVTVTRTRTVPGPVRTVVVPGPVRTRVVTVTVPPGRHR